jgi:hypothetical protein
MVRRTKRSPKATQDRNLFLSREVEQAKEVISNDGLVFHLQGTVPHGNIFITTSGGYCFGIYRLSKGVGEIGSKQSKMTFRAFINAIRESHQRFLTRKSAANAR